MKIVIEARLAGFSGRQGKELRWRGLSAIDETKQILPFQVWNDLGFPQQVVISSKFNSSRMVDWGKGVW